MKCWHNLSVFIKKIRKGCNVPCHDVTCIIDTFLIVYLNAPWAYFWENKHGKYALVHSNLEGQNEVYFKVQYGISYRKSDNVWQTLLINEYQSIFYTFIGYIYTTNVSIKITFLIIVNRFKLLLFSFHYLKQRKPSRHSTQHR